MSHSRTMNFAGVLKEDWSNDFDSSLKEITFSQVDITDDYLKCIVEKCPNLSTIVFTECKGILDKRLNYFSANCNYKKLKITIRNCENAENVTWDRVRELKFVPQPFDWYSIVRGIRTWTLWSLFFSLPLWSLFFSLLLRSSWDPE